MITINPGSGPVDGATAEHARTNARAFADELATALGRDPGDAQVTDHDTMQNGRGHFSIRLDEQSYEIEMPGLPLERVRYDGASDQNIWDFPRLYLDGSSWVWIYAIRVCLRDPDEEDAPT